VGCTDDGFHNWVGSVAEKEEQVAACMEFACLIVSYDGTYDT